MGTQSMRGYLFNPEGVLTAEASSEYLPVYPQPGWAECGANLWLDAPKTILARIKEQSRISAEDIGTIAFACIDASVVPVDENCNPIDNCIIWMDSRTGEQAQRLSGKISKKETLTISGSPITPFQNVTKLMWFKDQLHALATVTTPGGARACTAQILRSGGTRKTPLTTAHPRCILLSVIGGEAPVGGAGPDKMAG